MGNDIYVGGDWSVERYGERTNQGGWGEFVGWDVGEDIEVMKRGMGGRRWKRLVEEGRLQGPLHVMEGDDWVLVEMGDNEG
ncbi:hypothetical protein [Bacillus subtilis]|uniref:hypothetical protein n=1 Tax=Bacillus subtilis TaxID=1423 RepID=UPI0011A219E7|nr:hypothetical protein [Bacillus subtilis]